MVVVDVPGTPKHMGKMEKIWHVKKSGLLQ